MNVRAKNGKVLAVKLLKQEVTILESAIGICSMAGKVLTGERAGALAADASAALASLLSILTAEPPKKLESK
jgi:hypothetical protein